MANTHTHTKDTTPGEQQPLTHTDKEQILALLPSKIPLIFVLDVKAARQSGERFPGHYPTFANSIEQTWERRLNTDEITDQQADTFIYTG